MRLPAADTVMSRRRARTDDNQAAIVAALRQRKGHKYKAKPTVVDNIRFDSMREAARYQVLKLRERAGEISDLELQPTFSLTVRGVKIGTYRADFRYKERADLVRAQDQPAMFEVVEDSKGFRTPLYKWKKRHMLAEHGIEIREV